MGGMDLWNRGADASEADDVKVGRVGRAGRVGIFQFQYYYYSAMELSISIFGYLLDIHLGSCVIICK